MRLDDMERFLLDAEAEAEAEGDDDGDDPDEEGDDVDNDGAEAGATGLDAGEHLLMYLGGCNLQRRLHAVSVSTAYLFWGSPTLFTFVTVRMCAPRPFKLHSSRCQLHAGLSGHASVSTIWRLFKIL